MSDNVRLLKILFFLTMKNISTDNKIRKIRKLRRLFLSLIPVSTRVAVERTLLICDYYQFHQCRDDLKGPVD